MDVTWLDRPFRGHVQEDVANRTPAIENPVRFATDACVRAGERPPQANNFR